MSKRLSALLFLATLAGCAGDSFKPKAVISDVEPNFIAIGRSKQVEIHGDFTKWKESSIAPGDISFGADITVDAVTVGNEGFLLVTISASATAVPGPRDIEVDGEELNGAFFVNPAFEILDATIVQGDYALLDIVGYDTDWLEGRTELTFDQDIYTNEEDFFGIGFTSVLAPNYVQALVQADVFAATGAHALTISGLTKTDSVADAITIAAAEFTTLASGNNVTPLANGGYTAAKLRIPAGAVKSAQQILVSGGTADPYAIVFDPDLGMGVYVADLVDGDEYRAYNFAAGKDLFVFVWDFNWLDDAFFGDVTTTGDTLTANVGYGSFASAAITAATPLADQTVTAANGFSLYSLSAANRWNLVTASMTTPDAAATMDAVVQAVREGSAQSVLTVNAANDTGNSGDETLMFLAGGGLDAMIIVDPLGAGSGATTEHDIVFTEAAVAGELFEKNDIALAIPEEGQVDSTLTVAGATTAITAVHVLVDLDHTYRGDLYITIESPTGTVVTLFDGLGGSLDGLIEVFPDTLAEDGNLVDFAAEDANGTWTLHIEDLEAPDAGVVRGWAISFEGV